jgi:hypothetical protein
VAAAEEPARPRWILAGVSMALLCVQLDAFIGIALFGFA